MCKKESFVVSAAISLAVTVIMFFPVIGIAGSLEPSAAPASTMKTLDQIPPVWSQTLPAPQRFELVLGGAAVLDKETGLVWEQSPSTADVAWSTAIITCARKEVGGRKGWHLPSVEQLASLVDTSVAGAPKLPTGHPFTGVQVADLAHDFYWSSSIIEARTGYAWGVYFGNGSVDSSDFAFRFFGWCVRGAQSREAY